MSWHDIEEEQEKQESKATSVQISIIEGLLIRAAIPEMEKEQIDLCIERFSEEEAYKTINYLKEHQTFNDPADQWKNHINKKL